MSVFNFMIPSPWIIILTLTLSILICTPILAHFTGADWEIVDLYSEEERTIFHHVIFPEIQACKKTENIVIVHVLLQEPDYSKDDPNSYDDELSMSTWSDYLDDYYFDQDQSMVDDVYYAEFNRLISEDSHYQQLRFVVLIVIGVMIAFVIIVYFLDFFLSMAITIIICLIWKVISHRKIKRSGRRMCIKIELLRRRRERYLRPTHYNRGLIRLYYRVPGFFREYTSESEPEELLPLRNPITEDSSSDDSVNKRYRRHHKMEKERFDRLREDGDYWEDDSTSTTSDETNPVPDSDDVKKLRRVKRMVKKWRARQQISRHKAEIAEMERKRMEAEIENDKRMKLEAQRWRQRKFLERRKEVLRRHQKTFQEADDDGSTTDEKS